MSHSALSPQQLGAHVKAFVASTPHVHDDNAGDVPMAHLRDPDCATGLCAAADNAVATHLHGLGVPTEGRTFGTGGFIPHHYATEVPTTAGPHIVDLTYAQFENPGAKRRAPWPLVEPKSKYLRRSKFEEWDE